MVESWYNHRVFQESLVPSETYGQMEVSGYYVISIMDNPANNQPAL